ncbi:MAG: tetratricopeptide repeat protein [Candidatus Tectomicrobia bacterium]|nr:tetratricopeptide repeat protein [Candidatus Tectomicrobia bacterium]
MSWNSSTLSAGRAKVLLCLGLAALAVGLYASLLRAEFLFSWDDNRYIHENPFLRDLSPSGLWRLFSSFYFAAYLPLTLLSYAIDYRVWGLNPTGYHLTNVLLHAVNGVLVFLLLERLAGSRGVAALAAVLFVAHPAQVESVAWVAERKNVLSMSLFLGAFLAHIEAGPACASAGPRSGKDVAEPPGRRWEVLSWGLYLGAVLAKPIVVGAPLLFMAYDVAWRRFSWRRSLWRNLPPLAFALFGVILILLAHGEGGGIKPYAGGSLWAAARVMLRVTWEYLVTLLAPLKLNNLYLYDENSGAAAGRVWLGLGVLVASGVFAWRQPLGRPHSAFAVLWCWVFMLPVSNIVPIAVQRADRYLYFPSVALFMLVGIFVRLLWRACRGRRARWLLLGSLAAAVVTLGFLSQARTKVWLSSVALWRAHLTDYPRSATGLTNLGYALYRTRRYDEAVEVLRSLRALEPQHYKTPWYLAQIAAAKGRQEEAVDLFKEATSLNPQEKVIYNNLGDALYRLKRYDEALQAFQRALDLSPAYTRARLNASRAALRLGNFALARDASRRVLEIEPRNAEAASNLCLASSNLGRVMEAIAQCLGAAYAQPDNGLAWGRLAHVLLLAEHPDQALPAAQKAAARAPRSSLAFRTLGDAYAALGKRREAEQAYTTALRLDPGNRRARQALEKLATRPLQP